MINKDNLKKHLRLASSVQDEINKLDLFEVNEWLNELSGQNIPDKIVAGFLYTGGSNYEYLTSAYLSNRGYKNILQ